ncbi:hypothetical protein LZQ00_01515 [Sphingobacterium sp. SRCM116780]|uniref:hypothetical protein n=1 Tax=Sphingobacterium sp. SRCM116780 TaxID=2907623 RepID=UPI001F463D17|nr:hypothetical protein [Sphingobacterium sp. SRCM116780]UIR56511.1 hypothetical protein LZQ00_01515 [Sphingobacterium sp. SRCM116780]
MIKNAPFRFADFQSVVFRYGEPNHMDNQYDSRTGIFQYVTKTNQIEKDTVRMNKDDLLYLHRKAQELGFWNLDDDMTGPEARKNPKTATAPRFYLEFNYKDKSKKVTMDADFDGNEKMRDAGKSMIDEVNRILATAQSRSN